MPLYISNKKISRFISNYIENSYNVSEKWLENESENAKNRAQISSKREKVATKVEREAEDMKKAEYMEERIGEIYTGIISSITPFGIFVQLENTIEGCIRFENLGDEYFIYDENRKILIGERTNTTFKIGDKVQIEVIKASKILRQIDFKLVTKN